MCLPTISNWCGRVMRRTNRNQPIRRRNSNILYVCVGALVMITLSGILIGKARQVAPSPSLVVPSIGEPAPAFELEAVRGGYYRLKDFRSQLVLLSFIETRPGQEQNQRSSRSQVVFLRSIRVQYSIDALAIMLVDAAPSTGDVSAGQLDLLNLTYDWDLDALPLLVDPGAEVQRLYGVTQTPTTVLIDTNGRMLQRWNGYAPVAQLDIAIQALLPKRN